MASNSGTDGQENRCSPTSHPPPHGFESEATKNLRRTCSGLLHASLRLCLNVGRACLARIARAFLASERPTLLASPAHVDNFHLPALKRHR